jgi:hypothetical protein
MSRPMSAAAIAIGALIASRTAAAQDPRAVTIDVAACVEIASPDERFACYERRVDAARKGANEPPGTRPAQDAPAAAQPEAPRAEARLPDPRAPDHHIPAASDTEPAPRELVGLIASLQEPVPNNYVITLDNGQVWRQTTAKPYRLQPGQRVRIYPTTWGDAFRLTAADSKGFIQVRRVQ